MADKLIKIVEDYFTELRDAYRTGAGTGERTYYPAVNNLLNAIGADLKPRVHCISDVANTGAGHPDFGLYAASQLQKGEPLRKGQDPERGVIEMKSVADDAWLTARSSQVSKYFGAYRLVIVTNLRDFLILGEERSGAPGKRERFSLAKDAASFWQLVSTPRKSAEAVGKTFGEYLKRALTQSVALREPKDLAWFLASYARDALERVEAKKDLQGLDTIKKALEEALGMKFEADKGEHFFRSTLVQTLFYGVFSSWVLWARQTPAPTGRFEWRQAVWHLNVPFVSALYQQLAAPKQLQPLGLVELLDWTEATLNRIDNKQEFLQRFNDADAVQFFYEPFLEAFDPVLRKELGVWYTPSEVVAYMVARVDKALKEDLGVADGLASDNVYVLDPCCGTGAYVAAVLRRIDRTLSEKGYGDLKGQMVKKAALERVLGFEIMPAPFIVAHLQVGSVLQGLGASLTADHERASVYLTNALTGWEPTVTKPLPFPGLEEERKKAEKLKQEAPILVILGNPPYNGFAGMTIGEERDLSEAYRTTVRVRPPEGQGLNDLYVRFFRMAERRIVDRTGRGIVSFITNFEWLDGSSHTGMRERFSDVFGAIRIDCLNGDSRETGKLTPDGKPDPSVFSTEHNREGIRKGTAIATLLRKPKHEPTEQVSFRHLWGVTKRQELLDSADAEISYSRFAPSLELGLPFKATAVSAGYFSWPKLPELLVLSFSGVKTARDDFLVDVDRQALETRIEHYFDKHVSDEEIAQSYPVAMTPSDGFEPRSTRKELRTRGCGAGKIIRYVYRPFDVRWLYWDPDTKLLDRNRADYEPNVFAGNRWLTAAKALRKDADEPQYAVLTAIGSYHVIERASLFFPEYLSAPQRPNVSLAVESFLKARDTGVSGLFSHIAAILNAPAYRRENASAIALDWPRVPLPGDANLLRASSALGATLATLLDPETPAPGVSTGTLRAGLKTLGLPTRRDGKGLA